MHKSCKKLCSIFLLSMLIFSNGIVAEAADTSADLNKKGSITVALKDSDDKTTPIPNGKLELYKVGTVGVENGNLVYTPTEDFAGNGMSLDDLCAEKLAKQLEEWAHENKLAPLQSVTTDKEGEGKFTDLEMALYLVSQPEKVSDYNRMEPFLVSLPMTNAEGTGWIYDVTASPKIERYNQPLPNPDPKPDPDPSEPDKPIDPDNPEPPNPDENYKRLRVKKVWSDADANHEPIEVQLYCKNDKTKKDTITLSKENNWEYEWTNLDAKEDWYVLELSVPSEYKVSYETSDTQTVITNTKEDKKPVGPGTNPSTGGGGGGNTPLIQTGQLRWPIPVLAISGLLIFSMGWILRKRHKN